MKYKITITKVESVELIERGEWTIVEERPWTEEELGVERSAKYGDWQEFLKQNPLKEVYGYAQGRSAIKEVETEVLKQTVETLDLSAVIKAINGI